MYDKGFHFQTKGNTLTVKGKHLKRQSFNYWLFADLKKMLQGKRSSSNEEVIAETEAYFEKGIEKLEKHWNECITLEGNYVDE